MPDQLLSDDDQRRAPPARPYAPNGSARLLPADALAAASALLRAAGQREACVFLYGTRRGDHAVVEAVRAPAQANTRFNYHVEAAAMSLMSSTLADEWRPLAQVHSHPGVGVEHSRYDDLMVASRRALSFVFPNYGRIGGDWPSGIGVHEWQDGYWHLLSPELATSRVWMGPVAGVDVRDLR